MARLNDTEALKRRSPKDSDDYASTTVSVRKIDNGYVKSVCTSGAGGYKSSESFSSEKPTLEAGEQESNVGTESLRDATSYLNSKGK